MYRENLDKTIHSKEERNVCPKVVYAIRSENDGHEEKSF